MARVDVFWVLAGHSDDLLRVVLVEQLHCNRIKMVEFCLCVDRWVVTGRWLRVCEVLAGGVLKELGVLC